MAARLPLKPGSSDQKGDDVTHWYDWGKRYAKSYAFLLGPRDGYYGSHEAAFTREMQRRLGLVQDGIFGEVTAGRTGYAGAQPTPPRRPIWYYSAPGSGADWWLGPSFDLGQMLCGKGFNDPGRQSLNINHQPIGFAKGGYLGLMGGDPKLSYLDVIESQRNSLEFLLGSCPDRTNPDFEMWFSGYSQSADGMLEAINYLFGDQGEYKDLRSRINGLILFGNPATPKTGIARKRFPAWLNSLVHNINVKNDFYAIAPDKIRPLFYEWFIKAETEIPFVIYCGQIIIPALLNLVAPFLGAMGGGAFSGLFSTLTINAIGGATGVGSDLLGPIIGGIGGTDQKPNPELVELLSIQGILTSLPDLLGLLIALPGLQAHGLYHLPLPDFGNRTGPQVGYDIIAGFRRP